MLTFRFEDRGRLAGVRLYQEVGLEEVDFRPVPGGWELTVPRPAVHRMEYLFELLHRDGRRETVLDPGNPRRVAGVFGDKSVIEFPEYSPPGWLTAPVAPGEYATDLPGVTLWAPADGSGALPLLLVHDGPEYDALACLTRYLAAGLEGGWLPPVRAGLLHPGDRNATYSADDSYADSLAALTAKIPATVRVGMGTSLGALAMLHAHRRHPRLVDALFLQSGSYFHPRFDSHERRFPGYEPIVAFVRSVLEGTAHRPVPTVMTCGAIEENIHNNRLMAAALRAQGYPVTFREVPDVHNYTGWRDAFHPHLTRLLREVCP
ncbi:alpha/beta hydrolase [Thermoactinospora rubra]|uniref:alpha/beta hydrolase n=1 Tax=Thermoactinospora rubra TaxID=1088767 RepID=UPI000A10AE02|nr:hypothetical protein [Thermoactinospora rubra]